MNVRGNELSALTGVLALLFGIRVRLSTGEVIEVLIMDAALFMFLALASVIFWVSNKQQEFEMEIGPDLIFLVVFTLFLFLSIFHYTFYIFMVISYAILRVFIMMYNKGTLSDV